MWCDLPLHASSEVAFYRARGNRVVSATQSQFTALQQTETLGVYERGERREPTIHRVDTATGFVGDAE